MHQGGRLAGKVAIITGAASGIGRATALLFAREGARLALADLDDEGLTETLDLLGEEAARATAKRTDVSAEVEIEELVDVTLQEHSHIDILCNNAGILGELANLEDQDPDEWRRVFEVNVMGAVYGTKHVATHMQQRRCGAIVNTASVSGIRAGAGGNAYSASKAALINFTKTAACDLGAHNVRVNCVCPGLIETGMMKPVFDYARRVGKEHKLGSRCELRRYGSAEEVAGAILFLASDEASYITGQCLAVDGGLTTSASMPGMKM
jgi:NAD(P)-dependent dehydrogenase (short-subunit alcohol dehydrogenase family)